VTTHAASLSDAPRIVDQVDRERAILRAERIADVLDRAWRIPGTRIRFGADAVLGIVPVVGDTASTAIGIYPLAEAMRLGARKRIVARMALNLGVDWLIGLIPVVDLVFDVAYKANVRNARLLARELRRPRA